MLEEIGVGLLGLGNVAGSFLTLLEKNRALAEAKAGVRFSVKKILVRDLHKPRPFPLPPEILTTRADDVLCHRDIQVVIELMGGTRPAKDYILKALEHGKDVVTANKEVLAHYGPELFRQAAATGRHILFEASVGGAIPIIRPLVESLSGNQIIRLSGILNGTTNFILTKMEEEGLPLESALRLAQERGYCEADPSDDLEGRDAARKLAILASLAYNTVITPDQIHTRGITGLEPRDLALAKRLGYSIKLLAQAKKQEDDLALSVEPFLIARRKPLAQVHENYNAILVEGDASGETLFYGQGAGGLATASSIMGDLIELARLRPLPGPRWTFGGNGHYRVSSPLERPNAFYLRLGLSAGQGGGWPGALLSGQGIEIRTILQEGDEAVILTGQTTAAKIQTALARQESLRLRQILPLEA